MSNCLIRFAIRDSLIVLGTVVLLVVTPELVPLQLLLGLGLGLSAYLLHEWAHLLGATLVGARVNSPKSLLSPFLFSFDSGENTTRQFLHMTWPGFLATGIYISAYYLFLPDTLWGVIAWWMAVALTAATIFIEGPIALWIVFRNDLPPVEIPGLGENRLLNDLVGLLRGNR